MDVLTTYNDIASDWEEANKQDDRDIIYADRYKNIISQYEKRMDKVGGHLEIEKYDSFPKVRDIVSNI